jgi:hypothetical protein
MRAIALKLSYSLPIRARRRANALPESDDAEDSFDPDNDLYSDSSPENEP